MKKKIIITFACLLIFSGCGFKVVNNQKLHNFSIINVNTTGDNKIAYYLKNNLEEKKEIKNRKIDLDIKIRKDKTIKEKNIKNKLNPKTANPATPRPITVPPPKDTFNA